MRLPKFGMSKHCCAMLDAAASVSTKIMGEEESDEILLNWGKGTGNHRMYGEAPILRASLPLSAHGPSKDGTLLLNSSLVKMKQARILFCYFKVEPFQWNSPKGTPSSKLAGHLVLKGSWRTS